jgi:iron complex transport system substrate-binding protein
MNRARFRAVAAAALFFAASSHGANADAWTVKDGAGRTHEIADVSRIVTIGGAVTEIVYALGFGDRVIAVDITSTYPAAATKSKPSVGYMRALSPEGVLALAPKIILAIEGSGPKDAVEVLSRASVPFVVVPEGYDEASVLRKVRFVAQALGVPEKGEAMAKQIAEDFAAVTAMRAKITIAGEHTSAEGIFKLAGVDNAIRGLHGYKPATPEATQAAQPQAVVTLFERNHGLGEDVMFALPAFAGTPAAREKRLISIPSYYLSFGPRAAHAAQKLAASVYPELALPQLPPRPWTEAETARTR